jgi:L-alanine-DL-glutamate epimerase-like enolase superfamily enzyme
MMGFDRLVVYRLRVPLLIPYRLAFGPVEYFDTIIAEAVDRDGRAGFGEATILTGYTDETIDDSWNAAKQFAANLVANPATADPESAQREIASLGVKFPFTATSFGTALEMLGGSELLNVPAGVDVPLVGLLNAKDEEAMHTEVGQLLDASYRTLKVKVGFDVAKDILLVKAVQRVVNGRAGIRLDANQAYTADEGVTFVKALDPAGIELFEQPCAAGDWDSHLAVSRVSPVPMMLDESIYGLADIEKAAALEAAAYIKVKLMKLVTLGALVKAIERIKALGMKAVLGNGVACDPGCWMEACIAARTIDNAGEMNGFLKARAPLMRERLVFRGGAVLLQPGFWPRLDADGIKQYLVDSCVFERRTRSASAL